MPTPREPALPPGHLSDPDNWARSGPRCHRPGASPCPSPPSVPHLGGGGMLQTAPRAARAPPPPQTRRAERASHTNHTKTKTVQRPFLERPAFSEVDAVGPRFPLAGPAGRQAFHDNRRSPNLWPGRCLLRRRERGLAHRFRLRPASPGC